MSLWQIGIVSIPFIYTGYGAIYLYINSEKIYKLLTDVHKGHRLRVKDYFICIIATLITAPVLTFIDKSIKLK